MNAKYLKFSSILLPLILGIYSCQYTQDQTLVSNIGIDSIVVSKQSATNDLLTYDKYYYDKQGNCIQEIQIVINGKDTVEFSNLVTIGNKKEFFKKNNDYILNKEYDIPLEEEADSSFYNIHVNFSSPAVSYVLDQTLKKTKIDPFITQYSLSCLSNLDTFGTQKTYIFNQLLSREQFFESEDNQLKREIIYKYDTHGNIQSKAIKEKQNPRVYTYNNESFYKDGKWKKREEYLNQKLNSTQIQSIYYSTKE